MELRELSQIHIIALRPFILKPGKYLREQHGYRVKTAMFSFRPDPLSVPEKIAQLPTVDKDKCTRAYDFLMSSTDSTYKHFVDFCKQILAEAPFNP